MTDTLEVEPRSDAAGAAEEIAASFRASEQIFNGMDARLYAALCRHVVDDPEMLELAGHALAGARATHLFSAVHYLLLGEPDHPLARFFATLTETPAAPDDAYPEVARFCRERRAEILELLATRTVQTTYVERCRGLMPLIGFVADQLGEPLNLVEIGCSAGVLLAFDRYGYEVEGVGRIGEAGAPLTLEAEVLGGPRPRVPRIGRRVGLDLHLVDCASAEDRRWLLALCFPELRGEQQRLAAALDVVAGTDMELIEGDALAALPAVLARTPDPLCLYSSACLLYWSPAGRAALEALLVTASRGRDFYRVALEPTDDFDDWAKGRGPGAAAATPPKPGVVTIIRYRDGTAERRHVAQKLSPLGGLRWLDFAPF